MILRYIYDTTLFNMNWSFVNSPNTSLVVKNGTKSSQPVDKLHGSNMKFMLITPKPIIWTYFNTNLNRFGLACCLWHPIDMFYLPNLRFITWSLFSSDLEHSKLMTSCTILTNKSLDWLLFLFSYSPVPAIQITIKPQPILPS